MSGDGPWTLRGIHFQTSPGQAKLVACVRGAIWDVAVDLRRGSETFGRWRGYELSDANHRQLYVPVGFAHGFCVLSEHAQMEYKCTDFYAPDDELGLAWDDPEIGIDWPVDQPLLSAKDAAAPRISEVLDLLPVYSV